MTTRSAPRILASTVALLVIGLVSPAQNPSPSAPQTPMVKTIDVQYAGTETVSKEKILANMRTRVGRPYSQQAVEDDIRSLYATGNLSNVRIFGEPQGDGVKVVVVVAGKSNISSVELTGVTRFKESRLRKEIKSKPGDSLSEAALEQDRQKLLDYYVNHGYTDTDVKYEVQTDEHEGKTRVVFTVTEGNRTIVREVKFEGNAAFKPKVLAKVVKTKPKSLFNLFTKTGQLSSDQLGEDVTALREYYQNHGYIDVVVDPPRVDRTGNKVDVTFPVREGIQYHVAKVNYGGPKVVTEDEVEKATKLKTNSVYSPAGLRTDIKAIQDLYGSRGYVDFQAGASTSPAGPGLLNVNYTLEEGSQSYVEHVNISGNVRTKEKVIRREIAIAPGDILNTVRLDASKQRLQNLNYFSRVDAYPADTLIPGRKDVDIVVDEKRTGSFNFGAGFSSIDSLLGFAEITQSNFDITHWPTFTGGGEKFRLRIQYGVERKDFILSLTEPYFLDYKLSLGGELFYRDASFVSDVYSERRYGFDINARKALTEFVSGRLGYKLEDAGIHDIDPGVTHEIQKESGSRLKSEINAGLTYDTRDSVFLTRRGTRIDLSGYIAGGPLGGNEQIFGVDVEGSRYFLLPGDTILTINGEFSAVQTWGGGDKVPIFDRLFMGGANNLRGFRFREVGPKDDHGEPLGGKTLARATVEYTFPIVEKIRGAVFYDAGFLNGGGFSFSPREDPNGTGGFAQDVGIGLRLDLPIGPVRIDYGIPIEHDSKTGSGGQFNFNIGYQF